MWADRRMRVGQLLGPCGHLEVIHLISVLVFHDAECLNSPGRSRKDTALDPAFVGRDLIVFMIVHAMPN